MPNAYARCPTPQVERRRLNEELRDARDAAQRQSTTLAEQAA